MRSRRPVSLVSLIALAVFGLSLVMPGTASAGSARNIGILDRCDPATFNALFGEGMCVMRNSGVPVEPSWRESIQRTAVTTPGDSPQGR
jgi:hypothetical protein